MSKYLIELNILDPANREMVALIDPNKIVLAVEHIEYSEIDCTNIDCVLVKLEGLESSILYNGTLDDFKSTISKCDIKVVPSLNDHNNDYDF